MKSKIKHKKGENRHSKIFNLSTSENKDAQKIDWLPFIVKYHARTPAIPPSKRITKMAMRIFFKVFILFLFL